jgi:hypothetical protein
MEESREPHKTNKIKIVKDLPSSGYSPTVHVAMLHVINNNKVVETTIIQKYESALAGDEPVWIPLPKVIIKQAPKIIVPKFSLN